MKAVLQRVAEASVEVSGKMIASTGRGLLLLVGADQGDSEKNADFLADRCLGLRIFEDDEGKMNRSVVDVRGNLLAVSQFTLSANLSKGRRPSFTSAMKPPEFSCLTRTNSRSAAKRLWLGSSRVGTSNVSNPVLKRFE